MRSQTSVYAKLCKIQSGVYSPFETLLSPIPCVRWGQHLPHRDDMTRYSLIFAKCFEILCWEALWKCKGLSIIERNKKVQQLEGRGR